MPTKRTRTTQPKPDLLTSNDAAVIVWPALDKTNAPAMQNARRKLWQAIKSGHFPGAQKFGRDWLFTRADVNAYAAGLASVTIHPGRPETTGAGKKRSRAAVSGVNALAKVETTFGEVADGGLFEDADGKRWRKVAGGDEQNAKLYRPGVPVWGRFEAGAAVVALVRG